MRENRRLWESRELLLHGRTAGTEGYEVGFEEVFLHGELALVHGQYDVIALGWGEGTDLDGRGRKDKRWHFRVPVGFAIQAAKLCGDVLVLCGRGSTVAISARTGEILWDEPEAGEFYAGPYADGEVVLTVRKSPAEVSFRKVGSGRLLSRLRLPGLSTNRKHPVYASEGAEVDPAAAQSVEAYPVGFGQGVLALTDGLNYHVVDVRRREIRWSRAASKLDPSQDAAYRLWVDGGRLLALKPYYAVLENAVFDLDSGEMLWRRREGGAKVEKRLKEYAAADAAEGGKAAVGLVLSSMQFVDGTVYGIRYRMGSTDVDLVGMDPGSGNELMSVKRGGYESPEAYVEPSWSKDCVVVRIQDGNRFELWQVDVKQKKIVQRMQLEGYGRLGEYGDVSAVWQGPHLALWSFETRKFTTPPPPP
jgi:outer membrane protein assembly factor BamB